MRITSCIVSFVIALSSAISWSAPRKYEPRIPDQTLTYGDLCTPQNKDFGGLRYQEKIPYCERNVTPAQKNHIYEKYKIPVAKRHNYTIDHFIPLAIGGSNAAINLWPEHKKIKQLRMDLEIDVFYEMERGQITQKDAIKVITDAKLNPPIPVEAFEGHEYLEPIANPAEQNPTAGFN